LGPGVSSRTGFEVELKFAGMPSRSRTSRTRSSRGPAP